MKKRNAEIAAEIENMPFTEFKENVSSLREKISKENLKEFDKLAKESLEELKMDIYNFKSEKNQESCDKFYNKIKTILVTAYKFKHKDEDFETFRYILKNTTKKPSDFFEIFLCLPNYAQKAILKKLGYKNNIQFKKEFSKVVNTYKQDSTRRDIQEEEQNELQNRQKINL